MYMDISHVYIYMRKPNPRNKKTHTLKLRERERACVCRYSGVVCICWKREKKRKGSWALQSVGKRRSDELHFRTGGVEKNEFIYIFEEDEEQEM